MTRAALFAFPWIAWIAVGCASPGEPPPHVAVPPRLEESQIPSPLDVKQAIQIALENDPVGRGLRHRISEAYWRKVQMARLPNPSVGVSADPSEWIAGVLWWVDDVARQPARVDVGRSLEEQAILQLLRRQIQVAREVRTAYVEIETVRELESLLSKKAALVAAASEMARGQAQAGSVSQSEAKLSENLPLHVKVELAAVSAERQKWEGRLNTLLGSAPDSPRPLAFDLERDLSWADSQDRELALSRRPEIALVAAKVREHEAHLSLASLAWLPRAEGGPYLRRQTGEGRSVGGRLSVTIPIFDSGEGAQEAERAALRALKEEMAAAQARILLELHEAALEYKRTRTSGLEDLPRMLSTAQEAVATAEKARELGGRSRLEVLQVRLGEVDLAIALLRARGAMQKAVVELLASSGDTGE